MTTTGAVAAGDKVTAEAAAEILGEGGNAFDAALAAVMTACVAEPVLSSLAAGGFLLARPAHGEPLLYDFFCQTPGRLPRIEDIEFTPIHADFGPATQEFHIGMGAMAVPGFVAGLFAVHRDLGRLPFARLAVPALRAARDGVVISDLQSFILQAVAPIYRWNESGRRIYTSPTEPGQLLQGGDRFAMPEFADVLEALVGEGPELFYRGEIARAIARKSEEAGGVLNMADLNAYRVERRRPLSISYGGADILTNPAPSSGGPLLAFALGLLDTVGDLPTLADGPRHCLLASAMALSNQARRDGDLVEHCSDVAVRRLLSSEFMTAYLDQIRGLAEKTGGTTHISVIDGQGNAAALSVSNGEGNGHVLPDTGIMLNNMLGEEDLNPTGFFNWQPDSRITSMMAPTVAATAQGEILALGSGGSNRIRSAILQVLVNHLALDMPLGDAVSAPRIHYERGLLNIEHGHDPETVAALSAEFDERQDWPDLNFFFGGVHAVSADIGAGDFVAAGDPRRGGIARICR
jgi:gamma-glutamyltranspeptidase/glutathione hydrolase